ncbi:SLC13 family permease [Fimbriiglobus ruber]|uniref:Citrate transporter n=1 Tax=Fimbriiglobus ruber TaxID=1908690 RepID=A0A225D251_9BACT|nr:anion transporter [Fimbriiglobus ruber]OWK35602.1 citrate transporter [Fimbriiglobus ruber]
MGENAIYWLTLVIFVVTYTGIAIGRLPGLRTDRAGLALVGATGMVVAGALTFDEAVRAIDFETIALLLGMMIVIAYLRRAGFFERLAVHTLDRVSTPHGLLAATIALSGLLSAVLVNDIVCLALTPLVVQLARHLRFDPKPHLIGLALASNIGSTATPTGNPQNVIIGHLSHIGYLRFAAKLAPIALVGLVIAYVLVALIFRSALRPDSGNTPKTDGAADLPTPPGGHRHVRLLVKSGLVTVIAVGLFFAGLPMHLVALGAASFLLLDRVQPKKVYGQIDWSLLLMFSGLFVVVQAFDKHVVEQWGLAEWGPLRAHPIDLLSVVSAVLSNVVSNVPAVLLFRSVVPGLPPEVQESAWLALAMSSTLAGNLTVLGSVANLIVVENARREGISISLMDYCRVGVPVTLVTLLVGVAWLRFVPY